MRSRRSVFRMLFSLGLAPVGGLLAADGPAPSAKEKVSRLVLAAEKECHDAGLVCIPFIASFRAIYRVPPSVVQIVGLGPKIIPVLEDISTNGMDPKLGRNESGVSSLFILNACLQILRAKRFEVQSTEDSENGIQVTTYTVFGS